MPKVILDYLASVHPRFEKRTSKTAGTSYYMNVCGCGANFGDFYPFSEPILLHDSAGKPFLLECGHQLLIIEVAGYLEGFGTPGRRMGFHPGNRRGCPAHRLDAISQQRCTPSIFNEFTFSPLAPVSLASLTSPWLTFPKYPPATSASAAC